MVIVDLGELENSCKGLCSCKAREPVINAPKLIETHRSAWLPSGSKDRTKSVHNGHATTAPALRTFKDNDHPTTHPPVSSLLRDWKSGRNRNSFCSFPIGESQACNTLLYPISVSKLNPKTGMKLSYEFLR